MSSTFRSTGYPGRKPRVVHIKFNPAFNVITNDTKKGDGAHNPQLDSKTEGLISLLVNQYGISQSKSNELVKNHTEEKIMAGINYVINKGGSKPNLPGYIITAIEQDYAKSNVCSNLLSANTGHKGERKNSNRQNKPTLDECEDVVALIKNKYIQYCTSLIKAELLKLEPEKLGHFINQFKEKNACLLNNFSKGCNVSEMHTFEILDFISGPQFRFSLCTLYLEIYPKFKKELTEFSYFVNGEAPYHKKCFRTLMKTDSEKCKLEFLLKTIP